MEVTDNSNSEVPSHTHYFTERFNKGSLNVNIEMQVD